MTAEGIYDVFRKYAESQGMELNNNRAFVLDIIAGLLKNEERYGYRSCPCRLAAGIKERDEDIICPCRHKKEDVSEHGACYCNLYVSKEWNEGKISHTVVPERRSRRS